MDKPYELTVERKQLPLVLNVRDENGKLHLIGITDNKKAKAPKVRACSVEEVLNYFRNFCC